MRFTAFVGLQEYWKALSGGRRLFSIGHPKTTAYNGKYWNKEVLSRCQYSPRIKPIWIRRCSSEAAAKAPGSLGMGNRPLAKSSHTQEELQNEGSGSRRSQGAQSSQSEKAVALYKVQVATGRFWGSGTFDAISISLVGSEGESAKQPLNNMGKDFVPGAVDEYDMLSDRDLGQLLLVRLHKEPYRFFPEDNWFCSFVQLTTPQGQTFYFPCYQWIEGYRTLELREGTGKLVCDDAGHPLLLKHRADELKARQEAYQWAQFAPGMPRCLAVDSIQEMDTNTKFSLTKIGHFMLRASLTRLEIKLKGFMKCQESWEKLEDIRKVFWFNRTPVSEYVADHWQEDTFFGYQYLNGVNPVVIQKCTEIPNNFPVRQEMVAASLGQSTTLHEEVQKGNVFIVDYKILQDIPTNTIDGQPQYMTAPLCLLYQTPSGEMLPIAIQMWVRNADFHVHQNLSHLLRTHLMAEIFAMATLRQLPMCHPLFKLLIPHLRYTLQINTLARVRLIKEGGMMDQATSAGYEGIVPLVGKGAASLTYASLCLPDDIETRGVSTVANYYYRDDALKIWAAIESFVSGLVRFYYQNNSRVQSDPELQAWIHEIFTEGFQSRETSGAPSSMETTEELIKFLTMVIFTCSAQHAAVNSGQVSKGGHAQLKKLNSSQEAHLRWASFLFCSVLIADIAPRTSPYLSYRTTAPIFPRQYGRGRPLGYFPDQHFSEAEPKRLCQVFQNRLAEISEEIQQRNKSLPLPYEYLSPPLVENSVAI
ncbi:hypothetical protein JRQ81_004470 [Phrynocephalus forsythii]|uniref:Uncharacterized protein n=1 Tax=Phrynocephalus forsythii TaxID=171643 RepID=A0A9Q0XFT2_9SAUR|nr:hypothetical protein JRQ81_004470 [Phrynocephalus forsythii]